MRAFRSLRVFGHCLEPPTVTCALTTVMCLLTAAVVAADDGFTVVHAFDRGIDGRRPQTPLIQATDGNFYGTTVQGGVYDNGTIYRIVPGGTETVLHSFSDAVDGISPSALIEGTDGFFYGTARQTIGPSPFGLIFRMARDGTFAILHRFGCEADGANPADALVQADDGNFYGMTTGAGRADCIVSSMIYRMTPDGTVTTIHVFNAWVAPGSVVQARDGNLYGTTGAGGPFKGGMVFRMTLDGRVTVLHQFHYPDDVGDGTGPRGLVEAADGTFYGTTTAGGLCGYCGTVYRLSADGTFEVVYAFQRDGDTGTRPSALMQSRDGNFYGTTIVSGPTVLESVVFRMTPDGDLSVLYKLEGESDGYNPYAPLLEATDGAFYGTASEGGPSGTGTVFRVTPDGGFNVIYAFLGSEEGGSPSRLVQGIDGTIYGIAAAGGRFNGGTVFQVSADGTTRGLHAFRGRTDGAAPAALIQADDGTFYGVTGTGGAAGGGTFFQLAADGSFTVLYSFSADPRYSHPGSTGLLQATDRSIYGVTSNDGEYGRGVVFRWTADGTFSIVHSFTGGEDGGEPLALVQALDGNFYGITYHLGAQDSGTVFRMTPDGALTTVKVLGPRSTDLIAATDGNLYLLGGDIRRLTPDGTLTLVHALRGDEGSILEGLMQAADGHLYGTAFYGGTFNGGTLFRLTLDGALTVLHAFSQTDAWGPTRALIQARDGAFYGTTSSGGGPGKQGTLYRLTLP